MVAGVVVLLLAFTIPVSAAPKNVGLKVSPLRSYPSLDPGETTTGSLMITNQTPKDQTITLSAETFKVTNEQYDYNIEPSSTSDWVRFVDKLIILKPNQSQAVAYSLAVPSNATPGGHYFALLASSESAGGTGSITEVHRVASLIYLEVSGKLKKDSKLVSVDIPWFSSKTEVPISTLVANTGNTHIRARVGITVQRQPGGRVEQVSMVENVIMPGTVRKLDSKVHLPSVPGIYKISLTYAPPTGNPTVMSQTVWYFPQWCLIVIIGLLLVFIFGSVRVWQHTHYRLRPKKKE